MTVRQQFSWLVIGSLLALAGCGPRAAIEHYTVPSRAALNKINPETAGPVAASEGRRKPPPATEAPKGAPRNRMLGAIVPHDELLWFFKLSGPKDAVAKQAPAFENFVQSIHFAKNAAPAWDLPPGWHEQPGNQMRYATIQITSEPASPDNPPLELSVSKLGRPPGDSSEYLLPNVNRWRGQLSLPPIEAADLPKETRTLKLTEGTATLVDLLGTAGQNSMGPAPFFPGGGNGK